MNQDITLTGVEEHGPSRYVFIVSRIDGQWYAAFPDYHIAFPVPAHRPPIDFFFLKSNAQVSIPDSTQMADIVGRAQSASRQAASTEPSIPDLVRQLREG